jgi:cyanophycinase-like exopeptidase
VNFLGGCQVQNNQPNFPQIFPMNPPSFKLSTTHKTNGRRLAALLLAASLAGIGSVGHTAKPSTGGTSGGKLPYTYSVTGDPNFLVTAKRIGSAPLVLMGGGPDVDPAFRWMIQQAGISKGTGGRFVIIRATGTDAYNPYIYYSGPKNSTSSTIQDLWVGGASLGLTSVETLVLPTPEAANNQAANDIVARADAVFIAGGDQADYIRNWKNTKLEGTLGTLLGANVPIGGTSAGLAVLGMVDFAALNGTVTSPQALGNPYNTYMTFDPSPLSTKDGFLSPPALANTITDSHVDARDRLGRLIAFTSRMVMPGTATTGCVGGIVPAGEAAGTARGIGIGVEAALLVERNGSGDYVGTRTTNVSTTSESAIYFTRPVQAPATCKSGVPLTVRGVKVDKLKSGTFNLSTWTGPTTDIVTTVDVESGVMAPYQY